jgi:hypothetical protein
MYIHTKQGQVALAAAWSCGVVSACGVMGREIESRQGIGQKKPFKKKKSHV